MITSLLKRAAIGSIAALARAAIPAVAIADSGPKAGAEYSGSIGPGYPIHFKVSRNGKTIHALSVHFEATGKVIGRESIKSLGSCKQTEPFTAHVK
jgi:hypothetical protein